MKIKSAVLFAASTVLAGTTAHATAMNVTSIVLSNALGTYLQVAQVEAFNAGGTDVALASNGATASATSQYDYSGGSSGQSGPNNAINSTIGGDYFSSDPSQWIYHSAGSANDTLTITLSGPENLTQLDIFGRTDCCSYRDVYDVSLFAGSTLVDSFTNQSADNTNHEAVIPLPEPASWALMLVGFGALGFAMRRRATIRASFI